MHQTNPHPNGKATILIVDDEMDMRLFITTLFETSGYHAVAVRDGRQGLAKAAQLKPDLIILDVMMPGEGGAKMYQALKDDPDLNRIPVIMLSAVDQKAYHHFLQMLNSQAGRPIPAPQAYVEKPPDPDALLALAKKIIADALQSPGHMS